MTSASWGETRCFTDLSLPPASLRAEFVEAEMQLAELEHQAALERLEDRKMRERAKLESYRRARQRQLDELKSELCCGMV